MEIKDIRKWDELSLGEKSEVMRTAVRRGMTRLDEIRKAWNEYAEGGSMDTVGEYADAIYDNAIEEPYGDPTSHYNNVNEELLATMSPDARGPYDDAVKLPNHPSSPIRGTFNGNYFDLTDEGMTNPNYTLFGLLDNGDADTTLRYNDSYVLPEVTVTPQGNYYDDTYNNIRIKPKYADGGHLYKKGGVISQRNQRAGYAVDYFMNKGLSREAAAGLVGNLMRESGMNSSAVNPNSGAYGLGQWLGSRKTKLFKKYGKNPTFDNQLDYIWDELNTTHKKGLQMLRASKTVDDAARNAFGYYEFSAGPEAAVAAMNKNGKNTKWKNPNGTVAMNNGINNAWIAYGKATPKAKLGLNLGNTSTLGYNRTIPQFDFESIGDEIAEIRLPEQQFSANVLPPNPTDYGTPVDYSSLIRTEEPKGTQDEVFKDDGGLGLLSLISSLGGFREKQQQPLADYVPQKRSPFVVSAPASNNTLLDDSWFAEGGYFYDDGGQKGATIFRTPSGSLTTESGHPVEALDWDENGYRLYRDTVTGDIGHAYEPSEAATITEYTPMTRYLASPSGRVRANDKPLEAVYPEFDFLGLGSLTKDAAKLTARKLADKVWHSTYAQYPRYYLGKLYYGNEVELPTLYRKFRTFPKVENGKVQISPIENRFGFYTGEESPLITNMTTDVPVRPNTGGDWDEADALAFSGKSLLGKHVVSTRPSDTFTYGDLLTLKPSNVTYISGRPENIALAKANGMNTLTSSMAENAADKAIPKSEIGRIVLGENWRPYAQEVQSLSRISSRTPTEKDYKFMDWVFQPEYKSNVYPYQDLNQIPLNKMNIVPEDIREALGDDQSRGFLLDPKEWQNVLYDPATDAEDLFRRSKGIDLKIRIPAFRNK